jgi:hypothetical protein
MSMLLACVVALVLTVPADSRMGEDGPTTLLLAGDLMLGRQVSTIVSRDPVGLFEDVRMVVREADVAMANLESPLTSRSHVSANPHALEADPAAAALVAEAGFDVMSLANNHAGDAGAESVIDTIAAVEGAGMVTAGAGPNLDEARTPLLLEVEGIRVAVVAFDATGAGLPAGAGAGVVSWDPIAARESVTRAAEDSDLVVVSVHGGVEYLPESDPRMSEIARMLVEWGADVVWGHGAHVVQPVTTVLGIEGRRAVIATSLGNFLFDHRGTLTARGALLEVMTDRDGVIAYRLGATSHRDLRVHFEGWEDPAGDAALVEGAWWSLALDPGPLADPRTVVTDFEWGEVVAASAGRITGDDLETVVSFRQPAHPHPVREGLPEVDWTDAGGRTAHLGIYRTADMSPVWVAGMVPAPVAEVAACDSSIAMAYSGLDDPTVVATGAAVWRQFGLDASARLPGPGIPGCADIDGDGRTEPVILGRNGPVPTS